jgi:hypothetical protein
VASFQIGLGQPTGGESRELIYRASCRAAGRQTILDFRIPQKLVGRDKLAW